MFWIVYYVKYNFRFGNVDGYNVYDVHFCVGHQSNGIVCVDAVNVFTAHCQTNLFHLGVGRFWQTGKCAEPVIFVLLIIIILISGRYFTSNCNMEKYPIYFDEISENGQFGNCTDNPIIYNNYISPLSQCERIYLKMCHQNKYSYLSACGLFYINYSLIFHVNLSQFSH